MRRDVFQAIADPNRRAILGLLAKRSLNVNEISCHFKISRPAISKHVKVLTECGLIAIHPIGRERFCEAKLEKLNEVSAWLAKYKEFWDKKLNALENYLDQMQKEKKQSKRH